MDSNDEPVRKGRPRAMRPVGRRMLRWGGALGLLYLALAAFMYFAQTWLVLPGRRSQGWESARVHPSAGAEVVRLRTGRGDPFVALYGTALAASGRALPDARARPTLLYFYGTGAWLKTTVPDFERFRRLGVNVLVPEYVGYGMSGGSASEENCYATADAAYAYLLGRADSGRAPIVVAGSSLGGAVAIDLASRKTVAGLATFSTFTSMEDMARRQHGYLPIRLLLHQRFASVEKLPRVRCSIVMFHGTRDPFIPYSMMQRLASHATRPVTQVAVPDADHDHFFETGGDRKLPSLKAFVDHL